VAIASFQHRLKENCSAEIQSVKDNAGVLKAVATKTICELLEISVEEVMLALLPFAAEYSVAPISKFKVGAIVRGETQQPIGFPNLYLGANLEFKGTALNNSLHAEQAAVSNAWLAGERVIKGIAVTAAPCGHCRQFLYEFVNGSGLPVILPLDFLSQSETQNRKYRLIDLNELLPSAFGPNDLDICDSALTAKQGIKLDHDSIDSTISKEVITRLKEAAESSYAPYTENYSACLIEYSTGDSYVGRYVENAAFNPSLSPFVAALSQKILTTNSTDYDKIERVILLEQSAKCSNKNNIKQLLKKINKKTKFELIE